MSFKLTSLSNFTVLITVFAPIMIIKVKRKIKTNETNMRSEF